MTVIVYLCSRQVDIIKRIEIGLVGIVLVCQVGIDHITSITQTKCQSILILGIVEVSAGTISGQSTVSIIGKAAEV